MAEMSSADLSRGGCPTASRLLIIDDEPLIRHALADYLTECGYETVTAADGAEGLARARAERFHAVLVDLRMPEVDGLEVIATLQDEQPEVPVTVVSGTGVLNDAIEAMRRGAQDYVTKPIQDMDEVVVVVERVLEKARLIAERDRYQCELEQLNHSLEAEVARQTRDLQMQNRELLALNRVSYAISDPLDMDTMLSRAIDAAIAAIEADGGVVRLLDPATNELIVAAARGLPGPYLASAQAIPLGQGVVGRVAQDGQPRVGEDFADDPWLATLEEGRRFHTYLCVPLRAGDEAGEKHPIVGTLGVVTQSQRGFDEREVALLATVGNQIGVAVARAQYAADLKQANVRLEYLLTQIREQARQVQQIVDTVPEGVLLLDAARRIILANPVIKRDLAALAGTAGSTPLTRLGDRPLAELLEAPPAGLWHEATLGDRLFEVVARPIETGPTPGGWVLVVRDVTQRREIEQRAQQQEQLAAVGQLAAGVAHEINNPMTSVQGFAEFLLDEAPPDDPSREPLTIIMQEACRVRDIVRGLLNLARQTEFCTEQASVNQVVQEVLDLVRRRLDKEDITLEEHYAADLPPLGLDVGRMKQVMLNLITNAIHAMSQGGTLTVTSESVGDEVVVRIADTGGGIPPENLSRIFEPFFTTKPIGQGTGLGLSISRGIMQEHGGRIEVESQVGVGSTFTVWLPVEAAGCQEGALAE